MTTIELPRAPLESEDRPDGLEQPDGRDEHGIRVAADVHEPGVGKEVQQQPDPRRVGRRLEEEGPPLLERQGLEEVDQTGRPGGDLGGIGIAEREVAAVAGPAAREAPIHVRRVLGQDHVRDLIDPDW